jgi:hypothetical protein
LHQGLLVVSAKQPLRFAIFAKAALSNVREWRFDAQQFNFTTFSSNNLTVPELCKFQFVSSPA